MDIWNLTVDKGVTIIDAMRKLNETAKGILFLVEGDILKATITDGDIRRHILQNRGLADSVSAVANYNFRYVTPNQTEKAQLLIEQGKLKCVPVVSEEGQLLSAVFSHDVITQKKPELNIPVVIMAGGKGTRLYPHTKILPKPLIPIGDFTITEHIIGKFVEYGCVDFSLIVNHQKNLIKAYFADQQPEYSLSFYDEDEPLGTGGGLRLLEGSINGTFFMTNCDIIVNENYENILSYHKKKKNIITMVSATKNVTIPYGTLELNEEGGVVKVNEKPAFSFLTNTGLYVIEPRFLNYIPPNSFVPITDTIELCIANNERVGTYPISEDQWLDMGQLSELETMRKRLGVD